MFYNPVLLNINNKPVLCVINKGVEKLIHRKNELINDHIIKIFEDKDIKEGEYYVIFLRDNNGMLMTDLRCHGNIDEGISEGYGPILYPYIYENYTQTNKIGVASGLTMTILSQIENERKTIKHKDYHDMLDNIFIHEQYSLKNDFEI